MNITPGEAQTALNAIEQTTAKTRSNFVFWTFYMLVWGFVWTLGFLMLQFLSQLYIWIFIGMLIAGMAGSMILGIMQGKRMRPAPDSHSAFISLQIGIFNGVLYGFAILWLIVFSLNALQIGMLWISVTMLSSIVAGAWYRLAIPIIMGITITILSVPGYYLFPAYFWLWSAIFAGLPMIGLSLYYLWPNLQWLRHK